MIHTSRTVTVGKMESVINEPIMLYRGDREVEIEFNIVGSKFMFSNGGNVIKSTNATNGQLVINTPTGENMFSEVTECNDGKVICVITKEMIDELAEVGFYSFQIRLFDESQVSRVTIPPVYQGIEIRNPIAAEDETDLVDIGLVDFSVVRKDNYENVVTFLPNGDYNKTLWEEHDVISKDRLNKVEDALYEINKGTEGLYPTFQNQYDEFSAKVNKDVKAYKEEMDDEVEQFERDLNTGVERFKIDTNAAMTAHKNEVSEELESVNSQLELITTINISEFKNNTNSWVDAYYSALDKLNNKDGVLVFTEDCEIDNTLEVRKGLTITSNSSRGVKIKFIGEGNLFELKTDAWDKSIKFSNLYLIGNGTTGGVNSQGYGTNATNNAIYIGDMNNSELINTPFIIIENCKITRFNIGVYLEGYAHKLECCSIYGCDRGVVMIHPEQSSIRDCFIEYCVTGVDINPKEKAKSGHMFIYEGGALQRCVVGLHARAFYQLRVRTYCELNLNSDIILGDDGEYNYQYCVHGAILDIFSSTKLLSDCGIKLIQSQDIELHISSDLSYPTETPHLKADGWSKYITIYQEAEKVASSNPYVFIGNSANSAVIYKGVNKKYQNRDAVLTEYGTFATFKAGYNNYRETLSYQMNNAHFDIASNSKSAGFRLINNIDNAYTEMAYFYPGGNFVIKKGNVDLSDGDFVSYKNGGGLYIKSPDGTPYKIHVGDDGVLRATKQ